MHDSYKWYSTAQGKIPNLSKQQIYKSCSSHVDDWFRIDLNWKLTKPYISVGLLSPLEMAAQMSFQIAGLPEITQICIEINGKND